MTNPKAFISYSWSSPSHEQWVLDFSTELMENGVEIILDKWDLKAGHDAYAFMEKMVNDPEIKKVIIISDATYAAKADGRSGGVGTETQIISKEVYDNQQQDKFVAVIPERDEEGKFQVPTFYKSRIHIDLSEPDTYSENFEKLLRWIFDKPLNVKPELGKKPTFLEENNGISLGTLSSFKRTISAIKQNKTYSSGALDEYFSLFATNLEKFRISEYDGEFDEAVVANIESFLPHRNQAISIFYAIAQFASTEENIVKLHRFFESLIPYMDRPKDLMRCRRWDFDNFKFIVHELFLYAVAILLKSERFSAVNYLITQQYYWKNESRQTENEMYSYEVFRKYLESLKHRNDRLELNRLSIRADILEQRSNQSGLEFRYILQADFMLFLRAEIDGDVGYWWPETLLYLGRFHSTFEIFARSMSRKYFNEMKCVLAINKPSDLETLMNDFKNRKRELPKLGWNSINPHALMGFDLLATKP